MKNKKLISSLITVIVVVVLAFEMRPGTDGIKTVVPMDDERETVTLVRPVDGDTANFNTESFGNVNVRFSGVNTPETRHPTLGLEYYGKEASAFTREQLEKAGRIEIEWDKTQSPSHDRPIGIIFVDGVNLNLLLVEKGYADLRYLEEDMPYAKEYMEALERAMDNKLGRWK